MGKQIVVALLTATFVTGGPVMLPSLDVADAQNGQCLCYASFDAVDSDLRFVSRYYNSATINAPANACPGACDGWRREWFYWNACDFPIRINRGRNAWWGYYDGLSETHEGPDTWWCPFPPP
jgi:hypothetical protein